MTSSHAPTDTCRHQWTDYSSEQELVGWNRQARSMMIDSMAGTSGQAAMGRRLSPGKQAAMSRLALAGRQGHDRHWHSRQGTGGQAAAGTGGQVCSWAGRVEWADCQAATWQAVWQAVWQAAVGRHQQTGSSQLGFSWTGSSMAVPGKHQQGR